MFYYINQPCTPSFPILNNRINDHLEKCDLFSDFQYSFRCFWSTADLLTVVSDRTARDFNRSGGAQTVALDISKALDRVWCFGLLYKLNSYGISGQIFNLISSFLSNRQLWLVLGGKSSQENLVNARGPQGSIIHPTFFLLYIINFPDDVICNIAIDVHDTTLFCMWSDIWPVATTRIGFWTLILSTRPSDLRQEVACWFQCC